MFKPSQSAMKKISAASIKAERVKNYFAGSSIALAAFLLTVVMTFGYNSFSNIKNESDFQALFYDVRQDEITRISETEEISQFGLYMEVGREKKEDRSLSMLYTDQTMMDLTHARIVQGEFPTKPNEIAIEQDYVASEAGSPGLGEPIVLEYRNNASKQMQTKEFVISGWLQTTASGDDQRLGYNALVSKEFIAADPFLSQANYSVAFNINDADSYSNEALKSKIQDLGKQIGISEQNVQINHLNVDTNHLSGSTILFIACILFIIVLACSLVIYNIFYISINKRIRQYGQLRTLGTTRKQMKRLVLYEGKHLSRKYIPLGVLLGCLMSWLMNPSIWMMVPSLFLALLAGIFTSLTVRVSLNAPAKFAAKTSPIEAIKHVETGNYTKKERKISKRLTPFSLAALNLSRGKKKTMLTLLSLILSGILFISLATLLNSVDPVSKAKRYFPGNGHFNVQINSELYSETVNLSDLQSENQLSTDLKESILAINDVNSVIEHQYLEAAVKDAYTEEGAVVVGIENISTSNIQWLSEHLAAGTIPEIQSSDTAYILMNSASSEFEFYDFQHAVGDRISFIIGNGHEKVEHEFVIAGEIRDKDSRVPFYLPSEAMQAIAPFNPNRSFEVVMMENADEQLVKNELQHLIANKETLNLLSFSEVVASNKTAFKTITMVMYSFMAFIALFGVINLMNTIITTISARKTELGIMQAIGLDRRKLSAMLGYETGFLIIGSLIVALIAGNVIGYGISEVVGSQGGFSYIHYQFPLKAILLYAMAILLVQAGIIQFVKISTSRQTVVELLR
ncbi:ABC transporter permease [Paenibacillus fonticola]|uniref:ABC transporter permease n=1 Tax=Paenibacillus fonticola TaxID=379896 RepID=UPI00037FE7EB|nr:FtsX-like permease family protein [Paenibacillus fonticola]